MVLVKVDHTGVALNRVGIEDKIFRFQELRRVDGMGTDLVNPNILQTFEFEFDKDVHTQTLSFYVMRSRKLPPSQAVKQTGPKIYEFIKQATKPSSNHNALIQEINRLAPLVSSKQKDRIG